ncbi:valine--tRNA ligase [Candidatus Zixiibacteriota bacterium]
MAQMDKAYDPAAIEQRWYERWESEGAFAPAGDGEPFSITLPPPNVTGILHMGHALDQTLEDIPIRFHRMRGNRALWVPGTDHAGIATQNVVARALAEEGTSREEVGREAFVTRVWEWVDTYGGIIKNQIRRTGQSVDWERERFTMDEGLSEAVTQVFITLYERGLIYRGHYIINWCPHCHTALSNEEVKHVDRDSHLWHIRYPGSDGGPGVVVATTRPETMLGDTAIAVHPDDERYREIVGSTVILPLLDREIPVIADEAIDPAFGTGAVKVTPAHDPNDFAIAGRHDLPSLVAINDAAVITGVGGPYEGLDRFEARRRVVEDLETAELLVRIEDHQHSVGHCYRCDTAVEPALSDQWFVRMKPMAEKALAELERGRPRIQPPRWEKIYRQWLENIHDWCISRQLWWGHRIPVWYCQGESCETMLVSRSAPLDPCAECGGTSWEQDPDVLDTWFSSWLWPFTTMGWPRETEDMAEFYPTSLLISGYDILFFWDTRMVMAGLEFTGEVPFKTLYIHGMIQDEQGRPMSKSLGNGIDPIEMVEKYGADAVRYSLCLLTTEGQDMKLSESRFEMGRNFANKLWNASRFTLMHLEGGAIGEQGVEPETADRWILSRYNRCVDRVTQLLEDLKYADVAKELYAFVWNEFCDWYLEIVKERLFDAESPGAAAARSHLVYLLDGILRLLHPCMPFVTSEIWERLQEVLGRDAGSAFLMTSTWPEYQPDLVDSRAESDIDLLRAVISSVRAIRGEMHVPPGVRGNLIIRTGSGEAGSILEREKGMLLSLARLEGVEIGPDLTKPSGSAAAVIDDVELFLPLEDLIDLDVERGRLTAERDRLSSSLAASASKLENETFLDKAPPEVVEREREKLADMSERYTKLEELLAGLNV